MSDSLNPSIKLAELLIIKRDFDLLVKLTRSLCAEVKTNIMPYCSLFCCEAITYFNKTIRKVDISQTSKYSVKDMRQKAKFFDYKTTKKFFQSIESTDKLQNDFFIDQMTFSQLGILNIHDNLGVFFNDDKKIVGNSHFAYYLFQDDKMISKPKDLAKGSDLIEEDIRSFGYDIGKILGAVSSSFSILNDIIKSNVSADIITVHSNDLNTNKCALLGVGDTKIIHLFLLHVLTSVGFVLYILKRLVVEDTGLLLRIEYITYHYTIMRLNQTLEYCQNHSHLSTNIKLIDMLNSIDYMNTNRLRDKDFRSCMVHFGLTNKNMVPILKDNKINFSVPFCGLVESVFDMTYSDYKEKIETELTKIYDAINNYLNFESLLVDTAN